MIELTHVVQDALGFHARPVYVVASEASHYESTITFYKGERSASGKDALALLGINANKGDELRITIEGPDEEDAAEYLEYMMRRI